MEGRVSCGKTLLIALVLCALVNTSLCTLQEEISSNSVNVRFDEIYDIENWSKEMTESFTSSVTTAVNNYCMMASNYASCQISSYSSSFTVVLSAMSPEYFNGDIKMTFHVLIPEADRASDAEMEFVVPKATVTTIVTDNSEAINNATDETIVFIGDVRITTLDTSLDAIMIPIVCVLFVLVVLLAVFLTCMQSRGEKKIQEQRAQAIGGKGDEGITLTAVKSGSYASDDNNADTMTNATTAKKFRRHKKLKDGREERTRAPVQVEPEVQSSSNGSRTQIEVKPAGYTNDNFSSNNSNEALMPTRRSGSRHGIELPPLTSVPTPRTMSLDDSDSSEDKDKKRKKKHHRKLSKQSLVDAIDKDDEGEKSLSPLPEDYQGS